MSRCCGSWIPLNFCFPGRSSVDISRKVKVYALIDHFRVEFVFANDRQHFSVLHFRVVIHVYHFEHVSVTCVIVMCKQVFYQITESLEDSLLVNLVEDTVDGRGMGIVVDVNEGVGVDLPTSGLNYL